MNNIEHDHDAKNKLQVVLSKYNALRSNSVLNICIYWTSVTMYEQFDTASDTL